MNEDSLIDPEIQLGDDDVVDRALRPEYLQDFVGQAKIKEQAAQRYSVEVDDVDSFLPPLNN